MEAAQRAAQVCKCTTVWEWGRDLLCKAPFRQRITPTDNARSIVRGWDGERFPGCLNQCENICTSILSRLWVQEEDCEVCLPKGLASLLFALFDFITIRKVTFQAQTYSGRQGQHEGLNVLLNEHIHGQQLGGRMCRCILWLVVLVIQKLKVLRHLHRTYAYTL